MAEGMRMLQWVSAPPASINSTRTLGSSDSRAAMTLPIRQYPKLSNTVVTITTAYPGASPDLMQGFITTPLEQAVASAEGIDYNARWQQKFGAYTVTTNAQVTYNLAFARDAFALVMRMLPIPSRIEKEML